MGKEMSSDSTGTVVASCVVTALAAVCVALRFYLRIRTKAGIVWDDWWILASLLITLLTGGLVLWADNADPDAQSEISEVILNGTADTFDTAPHTTYLKLSFISSVLYFAIVTSIKISILLMYRRIFSVDASFRLQSLVLLGVVAAFWLGTTMTTLLNCQPLKYSWIGMSWKRYCINYNIFWMVSGIVEVVIDATILALPVGMVSRLHMSRTRKVLVLLVFLLGGFVIITGILRVTYAYVAGSRVPQYIKAELWSTIHVGIAIVCACLPPIRPLFANLPALFSKVFPRVWDRDSSSDGQPFKDATGSSTSGLSQCKDTSETIPQTGQKCPCGAFDLSHTNREQFFASTRLHECYWEASLGHAATADSAPDVSEGVPRRAEGERYRLRNSWIGRIVPWENEVEKRLG